ALRAPARPVPRLARRRALLVVAGAALAALVVALAVRGLRKPPVSLPSRLVVAEFANRTGDSALDAVGFMAADWITEGLQRLRTVSVVPMPAALEASRYLRAQAAAGPSPPSLPDETGADVVVSGAYYRNGDSLSFQMRITNVKLGELMMAVGPVAAPLTNPFLAVSE